MSVKPRYVIYDPVSDGLLLDNQSCGTTGYPMMGFVENLNLTIGGKFKIINHGDVIDASEINIIPIGKSIGKSIGEYGEHIIYIIANMEKIDDIFFQRGNQLKMFNNNILSHVAIDSVDDENGTYKTYSINDSYYKNAIIVLSIVCKIYYDYILHCKNANEPYTNITTEMLKYLVENYDYNSKYIIFTPGFNDPSTIQKINDTIIKYLTESNHVNILNFDIIKIIYRNLSKISQQNDTYEKFDEFKNIIQLAKTLTTMSILSAETNKYINYDEIIYEELNIILLYYAIEFLKTLLGISTGSIIDIDHIRKHSLKQPHDCAFNYHNEVIYIYDKFFAYRYNDNK